MLLSEAISMVGRLEKSLLTLGQSAGETSLFQQLRRRDYHSFGRDRVYNFLNFVLQDSYTSGMELRILNAAYTLLEDAEDKVAHQQEQDKEEAASIAAAFWREDKTADSQSASLFLLNTLEANLKIYTASPTLYVAPYVAVVGPSGIGKSFAVKELATKHQRYVVYINLSSVDSQGYPKRSGLANTIAGFSGLDIDTCGKAWKNLINLLRLEAKINHEVNISPHNFFYSQATDQGYMAGLASDLPDMEQFKTDMGEEILQNFEKARRERLLNHLPRDQMGSAAFFNITSTASLKCIICIDEARALLDAAGNNRVFRAFRHGARDVSDRDFFAVLLDTTSHVANFSPTALVDPSQKSVPKPVYIFEPIYSINTYDAFAESEPCVVDGTEETCRSIFKLGRPLWGAYLEHGLNLGQIQSLAGFKLGMESDPRYHLVLLAHRISFNVTNYNLADHMVAQCMRYIVHLSSDRSMLVTAMGSEPLLAFEAAARMADPSSRLRCLQGLSSAYGDGLINLGDVGEVVASLILLFSMDKTQIHLPKAVDLRSFFQALLGKKVADLITGKLGQDSPLKNLLENGMVYFNHFYRPCVAWSDMYPNHCIEKAFQRSAALFFPRNFPGADIGIPVYDPSRRKYSMLLIQVKNWKGGDKNSSFEKMTAHNSLEKARDHIEGLDDCFGLMMSLNANQPEKTGVAFCSESGRPSHPRRAKEERKRLFAVLSVGLSPGLYPSVCPDQSAELSQIFKCLCTLRDGDPFYRLGKYGPQTSRMVDNILDWQSDQVSRSFKRKASRSPSS